jgi:murein DD-endopeptidase MepM/ murein hydrolase activator NlpD
MAGLAGCATVAYVPTDVTRPEMPGIYHEAVKGETIWSISKLYNVKLENIIKANRLPDASKIEVGQLIFIPEASDADRRGSANVKNLEGFTWPVRGTVVSYFGSAKDMAKNKGIDIQAQAGMGVHASRSGTVTFLSDNLKGYGKTIIIDHRDGFQTVYAHNAENLVHIDQRVAQGDIVARVGTTGRADKPTLHFEIRKNHTPQNPFYYLP